MICYINEMPGSSYIPVPFRINICCLFYNSINEILLILGYKQLVSNPVKNYYPKMNPPNPLRLVPNLLPPMRPFFLSL